MPSPLSVQFVAGGIPSNTRYTKRTEVDALVSRQAGLMRSNATRAALIPIRKTAAWWEMAQDERRAVFEEQSRHIAIGPEYLPGAARRLHHSRELGKPFDFLTWFEYAPGGRAIGDQSDLSALSRGRAHRPQAAGSPQGRGDPCPDPGRGEAQRALVIGFRP